MKQSEVAVLSAAGVVVLVLVVMIAYLRVAIGDAKDVDEVVLVDLGERITEARNLDNFDSISVSGAWELDIKQGDDWHVQLTYPKNISQYLEIEVDNGKLHLGLEGVKSGKGKKDLHLEAKITMPALKTFDVAGAGNFKFKGFSGDKLSMTLAGAANIEGEEGRFANLDLQASGAGRVDLKEVKVHDANINLAGAGDVELTMDGGVLAGTVAGVGSIRYYGTIADNRVNVFGIGVVTKN